jgi:hypothetical protein
MNVKFRWLLVLAVIPLWAQALEIGERLAPWTLLDQYDQPFTLDNRTRRCWWRDMDGAKLVKQALKGQPKGYLEARHAVFVADIQRMPALIAKMFAVPAMRDYSYRVMLDRRPGGVALSRRCGSVLWLQLKDGRLLEQHEYATRPNCVRHWRRLAHDRRRVAVIKA